MAKFGVAAVFSNHMVLQRDCVISVFGTGEDGTEVTVEFDGASADCVVADGRWTAKLPPHAAADGGLSMTVRHGPESKSFSDIAVGEVWLAGGQSNMEYELQNCTGGADVLKNDKNTNVRFYYTQKNCVMDDKFFADEANTAWSVFSEENARAWSAVGYFFARKLAKELGVPVGIIGCNWGGTRASHWMSREALEKDEDTKEDLDAYDSAIKGKTKEELDRIYDEYLEYDAEWNKKSAVFYAENPDGDWDECQRVCGVNKYPGPLCPNNPFHATALYEAMIKRVCPYTIKGFLYYQGESDDTHPDKYFKLLRALIQQWRDNWGDDNLYFMNVQLPMHRYKGDSDRKHWCIIREAQEKVFRTVKNTGLAVIIDCGEFNEIHPKNKLPVGERLCMQALAAAYGDSRPEYFAPLYRSHIRIGNTIELSFDYCSGFAAPESGEGFEIAGADKKYVKADFEIRGDKIIVSSESVEKPLYVRYLWTNYGPVTVFGSNGLPLAPFRTDVNN